MIHITFTYGMYSILNPLDVQESLRTELTEKMFSDISQLFGIKDVDSVYIVFQQANMPQPQSFCIDMRIDTEVNVFLEKIKPFGSKFLDMVQVLLSENPRYRNEEKIPVWICYNGHMFLCKKS